MDFVTDSELKSVLVITQRNSITSERFVLAQLMKHINYLSTMIAIVDYPPLR